jgi:hypothetical protein
MHQRATASGGYFSDDRKEQSFVFNAACPDGCPRLQYPKGCGFKILLLTRYQHFVVNPGEMVKISNAGSFPQSSPGGEVEFFISIHTRLKEGRKPCQGNSKAKV